MNNTQESSSRTLLQLSSTFSKILKSKFGKGPETCFISMKENWIIVHVGNFMTPAETLLVETNNVSLAFSFRSAVMNSILKEFEQESTNILSFSICAYHYDWDYETNTGIVLLKIEGPDRNTHNDNAWNIPSLLDKNLIELIRNVSSKVHKVPKDFRIIRFNKNVIVVECEEVLLQIESVLYKKGHLDILNERSKEIKQSYNNYLPKFEEVFKKTLENYFITWDYKNDKNYIVFFLK